MTNIILATDSYKLNHWNQYPKDTEAVYSYFESRKGAEFPYTVFFGLQVILKNYLEGRRVDMDAVEQAHKIAEVHFGNTKLFNREGWKHIVNKHDGYLPVRIKAVAEGSVIPTSNILMSVENTCPECFWLTNALESLLTHVWYPSTVATLSRTTKELIKNALDKTTDNVDGLPFMLHDFGYRGVSSHESAEIGGLAHLINFMGTDTLPALVLGLEAYDANLETLGFSVPATEHSVMTARGKDGETEIVQQLLDEYPEGILSVVADSYNIYDFVENLGSTFKDQILARNGKLVVRPDSITKSHPNPGMLTAWILEQLWADFGGTTNSKGFRVLDPHIGVLWGDGIDQRGISKILGRIILAGFSAENLVFGMGGGLLQKLNRDTQRFAFKASAIKRNGEWTEIFKNPIDSSKASKKGKLKLVKMGNEFMTLPCEGDDVGLLKTVFENGKIIREYTFDEVRENAKL